MGNDKGLTLIEILAAITLFGVVISIFLSLFSDQLMLTNRVENELEAIHIAEITTEAIRSADLGEEIKSAACAGDGIVADDALIANDSRFAEGPPSYEDYTTFVGAPYKGRSYVVEMSARCPGEKEEDLDLYPITVKVYRADGTSPHYLTETYAYIKGGGASEE